MLFQSKKGQDVGEWKYGNMEMVQDVVVTSNISHSIIVKDRNLQPQTEQISY